jgi:hypothetical protein
MASLRVIGDPEGAIAIDSCDRRHGTDLDPIDPSGDPIRFRSDRK